MPDQLFASVAGPRKESFASAVLTFALPYLLAVVVLTGVQLLIRRGFDPKFGTAGSLVVAILFMGFLLILLLPSLFLWQRLPLGREASGVTTAGVAMTCGLILWCLSVFSDGSRLDAFFERFHLSSPLVRGFLIGTIVFWLSAVIVDALARLIRGVGKG